LAQVNSPDATVVNLETAQSEGDKREEDLQEALKEIQEKYRKHLKKPE